MAQLRIPPYRRKDLADISSRSRVIAHFVPNFLAVATRENPGVNLNDTVRLAFPEKHTLKPKITTLSYTQPELSPLKELFNFSHKRRCIFSNFSNKYVKY